MLNATLHELRSGPVPSFEFPAQRARPAPDALRAAAERLGKQAVFEANAEIYSEEAPACNAYRLLGGCVRICKLLEDGRRQIVAFRYPGDMFGHDAEGSHEFAAEAVTRCRVAVVRRRALEAAAAEDPALAAALLSCTMRELAAARRHAVVLGRNAASERVLSFLRDTAARLGTGERVELAMSRQEIADYLGLTIETVSRTLTHLAESGVIGLASSRTIRLHARVSMAA